MRQLVGRLKYQLQEVIRMNFAHYYQTLEGYNNHVDHEDLAR